MSDTVPGSLETWNTSDVPVAQTLSLHTPMLGANIAIYGVGGRLIVTITTEGDVKIADGITVTEAAQAFWDQVSQLARPKAS